MLNRLLKYGTYRTPRVVSEWAALAMEGIQTVIAQSVEISLDFPQDLQATVMIEGR
jgi:hypothetical protein